MRCGRIGEGSRLDAASRSRKPTLVLVFAVALAFLFAFLILPIHEQPRIEPRPLIQTGVDVRLMRDALFGRRHPRPLLVGCIFFKP